MTPKPRLRGVSHQWAFFVSLLTGTALVIAAPEGEATLAAAIYAVTVAGLFGTSDGPIIERDPRDEVEQRMFLIARILQHTNYQLAGERAVPGRSREAIEVLVRLTNDEDETYDVPFTVVQTEDEEWLIENIALEAITNR